MRNPQIEAAIRNYRRTAERYSENGMPFLQFAEQTAACERVLHDTGALSHTSNLDMGMRVAKTSHGMLGGRSDREEFSETVLLVTDGKHYSYSAATKRAVESIIGYAFNNSYIENRDDADRLLTAVDRKIDEQRGPLPIEHGGFRADYGDFETITLQYFSAAQAYIGGEVGFLEFAQQEARTEFLLDYDGSAFSSNANLGMGLRVAETAHEISGTAIDKNEFLETTLSKGESLFPAAAIGAAISIGDYAVKKGYVSPDQKSRFIADISRKIVGQMDPPTASRSVPQRELSDSLVL